MEPEVHRLDREQLLADHVAVAERVRREVDEMTAAAAEKRGAYMDWTLEALRGNDHRVLGAATVESTTSDREAARLLVASARAADDVREAARAEALRTLREAREASALVEAQTERERVILAEITERRVQAERDAEELLAEAGRVEGEMQERRAAAEREAERILAEAMAEADRVLTTADAEHRVLVEREAEAVLAEARADADRIGAELEERRKKLDAEAEEIRVRGREADRIVAATETERLRVRELLAGAIASLEVDQQARAHHPESLAGDLASRLHGTTEPIEPTLT